MWLYYAYLFLKLRDSAFVVSSSRYPDAVIFTLSIVSVEVRLNVNSLKEPERIDSGQRH
jgi:hypothetical protein